MSCRWDAVRCERVVARDVLDVEKLVFRSDLGHGNELDAIFSPVRCVHEQVSEIAWSLAAFQRLTQVVYIVLTGASAAACVWLFLRLLNLRIP
jgi:hypothetical protein